MINHPLIGLAPQFKVIVRPFLFGAIGPNNVIDYFHPAVSFGSALAPRTMINYVIWQELFVEENRFRPTMNYWPGAFFEVEFV